MRRKSVLSELFSKALQMQVIKTCLKFNYQAFIYITALSVSFYIYFPDKEANLTFQRACARLHKMFVL